MDNKNPNIIELITANIDSDPNQEIEQILGISVDAVTFKHVKRIFQFIKHHQAKKEKPSLLRVTIVGPRQEVKHG